MEKNNTIGKIIAAALGAVIMVLIILCGWVMSVQGAQSRAGERIATNETEMKNMKEYLKPVLTRMDEQLQRIEAQLLKIPRP